MAKILSLSEFISVEESYRFSNNQEAEETKALVISKLDEIGANTDDIKWVTDTCFTTKDGKNGSVFDSEIDAEKSVLTGENHEKALEFVKNSDMIWKIYLQEAGFSSKEAKQIIDNEQWDELVEIIVNYDGPEYFLSTFSGEVYDLDNDKLLYY